MNTIPFNTLLVPVDFSPASHAAFTHAVNLVEGDNPVLIVLHVIDSSLVEFATSHGLCSQEDATQRMRQFAEQQLAAFKEHGGEQIEVDTIVSEGVPFLEILKKADDFAVDAIFIGKVGTRERPEKLLFGSTVEKVIRGSTRPVLVLPMQAESAGEA